MQKRDNMSNLQLFIMVIAVIVPFGHFVYVYLAIQNAGRDAWISLLLGGLVSALIVYVQFRLNAMHEGLTLIDKTQRVFGRWVGSVLGFLYLLFFLLACIVTLHLLDLFLGMIYRQTPPVVFLGILLFLMTWVCAYGVDVVARVMQLFLPILVLLGFAASALAMKDKDISNLFPILNHGTLPVLQGSVVFMAMFAEMVLFGMISPNANEAKKLTKHAFWTLAILIFMFLGPITGPILIFGEDVAKYLIYPTYAEISYIEYPTVLERLDIIGILLWTIGAFFRVSAYCFGSTRSCAVLLSLKHERRALFVTVPIIAVATYYSDVYMSREWTYALLQTDYLWIAIGIGFALPLLTLIMAWLRHLSQRTMPRHT